MKRIRLSASACFVPLCELTLATEKRREREKERERRGEEGVRRYVIDGIVEEVQVRQRPPYILSPVMHCLQHAQTDRRERKKKQGEIERHKNTDGESTLSISKSISWSLKYAFQVDEGSVLSGCASSAERKCSRSRTVQAKGEAHMVVKLPVSSLARLLATSATLKDRDAPIGRDTEKDCSNTLS
jgi:hypothetical protein